MVRGRGSALGRASEGAHIRAGAVLVVAGLVAEGETEVRASSTSTADTKTSWASRGPSGQMSSGSPPSATREHLGRFGGLPHCQSAPSATDEGLCACASRSSRQLKPSGPRSQADGGDMFLRDVDEETGVVTVSLLGACGTCPASTGAPQGGHRADHEGPRRGCDRRRRRVAAPDRLGCLRRAST